MEVCPTGAIISTEFDTVFIQQDVCTGCRNCVAACPYGVIGMDQKTGTAHKCTLCYDRLQGGLEPACAKACPTQSIQFGPLAELQQAADVRLAALHSQGVTQAQLYGRDDKVYGGLNAFFLLMDKPETYGLPNADNAELPSRNDVGGYLTAAVTAVLAVIAGLVAFRRRGMGWCGSSRSTSSSPRSGPGTSSSTFSSRGLRPAPMCSGRCCDSRAILGMSRRRESRSWCASPPP